MHTGARLGNARVWILLMLGLSIAAALPSLRAEEEIDAPLILVAAPQMSGFYQRSVLIAIPVPGNRHVGFIINRPTELSMAGLFPKHDPSRKVVMPVFLGGPEMVNSIFAMLKSSDSPGGNSFTVLPGVLVVAEARSIDKIIEQTPNDARYYAGFVAWQPGELRTELDRGFWFVLKARPELMFRPDVSRMWEELLERSSKVWTHVRIPDHSTAAVRLTQAVRTR